MVEKNIMYTDHARHTISTRPIGHVPSYTLMYAERNLPAPSRSRPSVIKTTDYTPSDLAKVLIPISIGGWLLFGVGCILLINARGRAGRWVPEWYLDAQGTFRDKATVVFWWFAVMVFWPVILPVVGIRKVVVRWKKWRNLREIKAEKVLRSKNRSEEGGRPVCRERGGVRGADGMPTFMCV